MQRTLLVVDDEEPILFAVDEFFTSRGFKVDSARSIEEARSFLEREGYAVVLLDLKLGAAGGEGLEVARLARRRCPSTPVIMITAYGSPEVESQARCIGVAGFLHKPQPLREMARIVDDVIGACAGAGRSSEETSD